MKVMLFENRLAFRKWLTIHAKSHEGIYIKISKNNRLKTISATDALKEALCFGWIDSTIKRIDDDTYIKYFARRTNESTWSLRNRVFADELIHLNQMTELGFETINHAKKNGLWDVVIDNEENFVTSFFDIIKPYPLALANYLKMSESIKKTYATHYFMAKKEETKIKRLNEIVDRLNLNLKPF
jgi:uncharacterized protein YdeI (YjbR/CyaY-like superfamily)